MNQYSDLNMPLADMGQRYDPVRERQNLFDAIKASIMGRPVQQPSTQREALIQRVTQQGAPQPTTVGEGVGQGIASIGHGLSLRQMNRGPFPEMPGGGQPGPFMGLANMFGLSRGGLY